MNIVVCVKYVPDAQSDRSFNEADNTTDRDGVEGLLSEIDEYAVEEALKAAEAGDGEVTVVTVGPERAVDAVKKALQMGAGKGVHVSDEAIHGSDAAATSLILAEAVKKASGGENPDLVLMGMSSTDGVMGVVPAMVAERLGLPQVTYASEPHHRRRQGLDPPRRRRRVRDHRVDAARAGLGHRPDQRAALPLVQGDHGRQEEAGRDVVARRPRCRRRSGRPRRRVDQGDVVRQAPAA